MNLGSCLRWGFILCRYRGWISSCGLTAWTVCGQFWWFERKSRAFYIISLAMLQLTSSVFLESRLFWKDIRDWCLQLTTTPCFEVSWSDSGSWVLLYLFNLFSWFAWSSWSPDFVIVWLDCPPMECEGTCVLQGIAVKSLLKLGS